MNKDSLQEKTCVDGIVLLAKQTGLTSFSALNDVKHALKTTKVGHTGTLDSFAQGLLVVCVGRLTKLAGNITEFDKDYSAIIKFGQETDTLEYTGNVIKTSSLPTLDKLREAIAHFTGEQLQKPPEFSAIHVNGKRASDLKRAGEQVEIPPRKINVYSSELIDYKLNDENLVEFCQINFSVSKGTYIRSLARDIADYCGSSGHLAGLFRTRIANFRIEEAAGFDLLEAFNIENTIKSLEKFNSEQNNENSNNSIKTESLELRNLIHSQIKEKLQQFTIPTAKICGFKILHLKDSLFEDCFKNGKKLFKNFFVEDLQLISNYSTVAVFTIDDKFVGLIEKNETGKLNYKFVIN